MRSFASLRATGRLVGITQHVELVNVVEFVRFRFSRARHAGQLLIKPEIILDRDGGEGLRFAIDLHRFLCFHRLMQPVAPAPARHLAAGIFIHDDDFVFLHDVLHVLFEQAIGAQQLRDVVNSLRLRVAKLLPFPFLFFLLLRRSTTDLDRSQ